ncbi:MULTISPECIES: thermonuclease family protein [Blastomonas]|uniref:thermonuclease family protein n=1 Tax=Blastomonas TaxID=150203 RepID=UPI000B33B54A|nr:MULTISPECIES: thermonuclease family protein [Blastomonas]
MPNVEAELGERATARSVDLLNGGFSLQDADRDEDKYGRKLRVVTRDEASLGETLISKGLAERWSGRRRNWCTAGA